MWFYRYTYFFLFLIDFWFSFIPIVYKSLDSGYACTSVFNLLVYVSFMIKIIYNIYLLEENRVFEITVNRDFKSVCFKSRIYICTYKLFASQICHKKLVSFMSICNFVKLFESVEKPDFRWIDAILVWYRFVCLSGHLFDYIHEQFTTTSTRKLI